jgi:G3E family GTPase
LEKVSSNREGVTILNASKIELVILSGFLGSGKSTLLKKLIEHEKKKERSIAVLMNELGHISIDSASVPANVPLKEMLNGCICCTMQGELGVQLKELTEEHDLDVIFIEATGAAHPLDVLDACTHPLLADKLEIKAVITVVNAKQWYEQKLSNMLKKLLQHQVKFADIVLINKIDQLNESGLMSVRDSIKETNGQAKILSTHYSEMDFSLLDGGLSEQLTQKNTKDKETDIEHLHLQTCAIPINHSIDRIKLNEWLEKSNQSILRAKGFIQLTETPGIYLFNYSYGYPTFERVKQSVNVEPVLVFIGENLDKKALKKELEEVVGEKYLSIKNQ